MHTWSLKSSSGDRPRVILRARSQRSSSGNSLASGQPGECHLSSPQRHTQRRRGKLRAHWDAGDRLERGQARTREGVRWFKCLFAPHARERSTFGFGRLKQQQGGRPSDPRFGDKVSVRHRTEELTQHAPHAFGARIRCPRFHEDVGERDCERCSVVGQPASESSRT